MDKTYKIKKIGCHLDNQSPLLTLKSNTMKNTVQKYKLFFMLQNIF